VPGVGDQPGGLLGRVQRVQSQHHPGHVQPAEQVGDDGALAAFVGDLPLAQHDPGAVADRCDQNTRPAAVTVPRSSFPSIAAAGSSPAGAGWVTARVAARRCSRSTGPAGPAGAGRTGAGLTPRTTSLAYPPIAASNASPSNACNTRRNVRSLGTRYRPVRGSNRAPIRCRTSCEVRAAHCQIAATQSLPTTQARARGQHQNHHQGMPAAPPGTRIGHRRQPVGQRRRHLRDRRELGLPQGQIRKLVNGRADRGRYRHEHDSWIDLLA